MDKFVEFVSAVGLLNFVDEFYLPAPYMAGKTDISYSQHQPPAPPTQSKISPSSSKLGVIFEHDAALLRMLNLATYVGLQSEVLIIDAANRFDLHFVAYGIRRITPWWEEVANRVHIVRAFTCYEALKALEQVPSDSAPLLAIDLLATFYDESVNDAEAFRLTHRCVIELLRISASTPAVVSLSPPPSDIPSRRSLVKLIKEATDQTYTEAPFAEPVHQPCLF